MMTSSVLNSQIPSFYPPSNSLHLTCAFLKYNRSQLSNGSTPNPITQPLALCIELDLPIALPKCIWSDSNSNGTLFISSALCLSFFTRKLWENNVHPYKKSHISNSIIHTTANLKNYTKL